MSYNINNIIDKYLKIKNYYDNILNKDKKLIKTSNDEPTPISCIEDFVNKISDINKDIWKKNLKILDPCCGCGNFFIPILKELVKHHDIKSVVENMLYFNDINNDRISIVKKVFCDSKYNLNITEYDYLEYKNPIKYDIIVANPPYAKLLKDGKRASKNHNMIGSFIKKSLKLLKKNGLLLFITPNNWMSYSNRNTLIQELTTKQIHYLNIHTAKKYFKKIGSSFTWYIIENTDSYKDIEIEGVWKKKEYKSIVKSEIKNYIPLFYNSTIQNILNKTIDNKKLSKFNIETSSFLHKYTKKKFISNKKDEIFKYKLIHTPTQTVWSSKPHKYQDGYKIFIGTTSYYKTFIDNCGMTQSIAFIRCKDKKEAENKNKILNHPLYIFINNICRYGNFNNIRILQSFPICDNYDNVYKLFNITKDESEFIINNL